MVKIGIKSYIGKTGYDPDILEISYFVSGKRIVVEPRSFYVYVYCPEDYANFLHGSKSGIYND